MTTIDHQQAAVRAIADALPGISGDGEDHLREATAVSALTAATPHLRAEWAAELLDEGILGAGYSVLMNPVAGDHPVATFTHAIRHMLTLLEGGGE